MSAIEAAAGAESALNRCAQCGWTLFAPVWSEQVNARCVRHLWNCGACGYAFETTAYFAAQEIAEEAVDKAA